MKTIVHPTDFSANAAKALVYAFKLAEKIDARLVVLHIGDLPTIMNSPSDLPSFAEMEKAHQDNFVEQLRNYTITYLGVQVRESRIDYQARLHRSRSQGILAFVREISADVVVIGMRGESLFTEFVLGSTAKDLVRKVSCPVLIIPPDAAYAPIGKVVYAFDYEEEDRLVLQSLVDLGIAKGAEVSLLHVIVAEGKEEKDVVGLKKEMTAHFNDHLLHFDDREGADIYETIMHYISDKRPDLLVMLERKHENTLENLFHKDLVKRFATHSEVPVLSFNQHSLQVGSVI